MYFLFILSAKYSGLPLRGVGKKSVLSRESEITGIHGWDVVSENRPVTTARQVPLSLTRNMSQHSILVELDIILSTAQLWFLTICVVYIQHINKKSMHNNVVRLLSLIQASCSLTMTTLLPLTLKNNGLSWNAHRDITYTWSEQINLPTNLSSFLPETIYHAMKEVKCIHKVTGLNQPLRDSLHLVQMISRYNDVDVDVSVVANLKLWLWSEIWDKSQV